MPKVMVVMFILWTIVVDSSLPRSLAHITSNAEYYGPSIYLPGEYTMKDLLFIF